MSHASVYVLDISVLLNTPDSLYEFPEQEIVLPVSILDALDALRQDLGEKGRAANLVSKMLDECRQLGIDLAFGKIKTKDKKKKTLFPALVEDPRFNWKRHDFTQEAESDPNQSWYQEEESDDDYDDDYENGWYESKVTEAKKLTIKDVEKAWDFSYGEDFEYEYGSVYVEIMGKYKGKITKDELAKIWDDKYGEDLQSEHGGFFDKLDENLNEATVVMDAMDPKSKILKKLLKKHKVTMKVLDPSGPSGWPEVELTGSREDLQAVLASEDGWDDPELGEYIEESNTVTEAKDPYKEIEKAIKGMKGVSADIKGDTIIVSNKAGDEFTYSMNDADDVAEFIATIEESVVTESKEMSKKEVRDLKVKINNARTIGKYFTKDEVEFLQSLFESEVNEAKKYKFKELAKAWEFVYGEDMEDEYEGFYQEVIGKHKNKVTKSDIAEIWSNVYGEDVAAEYGGFFDNLKENVNEATKLEKFNNIEEANADGTISDDEDDAVENMLVDVEYMVDELVNYIKVETEKIGGSFRSPGYEAQCLKLVKETFKKHKVRL